MANSDFITLKTKEAGDRLMEMAESGIYYFPGTGSRVYRRGDFDFEIYGGNRGDRDRITETALNLDRAAAPDAATERQKNYLKTLIYRDPGAAMSCGASPDGKSLRDDLSKSQASKMIDYILRS